MTPHYGQPTCAGSWGSAFFPLGLGQHLLPWPPGLAWLAQKAASPGAVCVGIEEEGEGQECAQCPTHVWQVHISVNVTAHL